MEASIAAPSHLTWRQDLHIQVMNIHRNSKVEEILDEYHNLQRSNLFTDVDFIVKHGHKKSVHSLVLAASSDFLKQWMEGSFPLPCTRFTIILPEVDQVELDIILSILYGVDSAVPDELVSKINELADMLGISVDLPYRVIRHSDEGEARLELVDPNDSLNPICCWHCNQTVASFDDLKVHLMNNHAGAQLAKKKVHRCLECNKVLPNIWKLRQHYRQHTLRKRPIRSDPVVTARSRSPVPPPPVPVSPRRASPKPEADLEAGEKSPLKKKRLDPIRDDHSYDFRRHKTIPKLPDDRSDHQYSTRRLRKLPAKLNSPPLPDLKATPASIIANTAQPSPDPGLTQIGKPNPDPEPEFSTPLIPPKRTRPRIPLKSTQSIQAMGHSYAAARPRRISGSLTGGKGPLTTQMYPCDQCDKTFPQPYRLNRHIKEVHIKEKRHFCQFCDKAFYKSTSKDRHELTHSDHQLWRCETCSKTFRDQSSLKYHVGHNVCEKGGK